MAKRCRNDEIVYNAPRPRLILGDSSANSGDDDGVEVLVQMDGKGVLSRREEPLHRPRQPKASSR